MDKIDYKIIELLKGNGKLSNVELGGILHLSSQAVGARRTKLENSNAISNYTIDSNIYKSSFIEIYLNDNNFSSFEKAIADHVGNITLHKISGSYCYLLIYEEVVSLFDQSLTELLMIIEKYARYKVNVSLKKIC